MIFDITSHNVDYAKLSPDRAIFLNRILQKKAVIHNLSGHCAQSFFLNIIDYLQSIVEIKLNHS